jgi:wyosine [tRNA(Phe)-imidazoG37] synthetase (radical SAM superfamily)
LGGWFSNPPKTMRLRSGKITIENTNLCPANCTICPRDQYKQPLGTMDMNLFKKIINQLSQCTNVDTVDIGGFGEPFADKLLFERCEYIRQKLPKVRIFTSSNCYLMTPNKYDDVVKYIDALKISVQGVTPETYAKCHRGKVTFQKTYDNILGLLKREKKPYTIGLLTLTDENKHEKDEWLKFWEPRLDEVYIWLPHNFGGTMNYRTIDRTRQQSCGRPVNGPLYVHLDGTVSMCCLDINKNLAIGNMNTQTIPEIFNSTAYKRIKRAHREGNFKGLLCENCCQTNFNPDVLVYATNKERGVGKLNSNLKNLREP